MMVTTACWITLSSSAAMPNGRCRPSAFGIDGVSLMLEHEAERVKALCTQGRNVRGVKIKLEIRASAI
jgi:hypothetical protein